MRAAFAIAHATFREALRDKVPYVLLFFAVLVILGSEGLAVLAIGAAEKVAVDLGLSAIAFFGALIAAFLGISQISQEISRRTVFTVVSKPIPRSIFIVGKLMGVYATVVLLTTSMAVIFFGFISLRYGIFNWGLVASVWLSLIEDLIMASIAVLFSTLTSTTLASLITLTAYAIGHLSYGLEMLAKFREFEHTVWPSVLMALYFLAPNLEWLNVRSMVVHGDPLPNGVLLPTAYGIVYSIAIILVAMEIFRRRDFL